MKTLALVALLASPAAAFPGGAPGASPRSHKGTVQETLSAGGYTYLLLKTPGGEQWAAVEKTSLKKGAAVEVMESAVMEDFESPSLKRRFKTVVFGVLAGAPAAAAAPAAAPAPAPAPAAKGPRPAGPAASVSVADAHKRRKELAGRLVSVTGKVVKANSGILGRNWLHLRDGTGAEKAGDNDLTVTGAGSAKVGDTVRAVGVLAADRDFGSGYAYGVILEDAELLKP